jgi:uncharacterized protein YrrD
MTIHYLRPHEVGGHPIEYHKAHPEVGGIDVVVWQDARRHEGFLLNCRDWQHAHELVDVIRREKEAGQ